MGIRDEEIKRLIWYGKAFGAEINIRYYNNDDIGGIVFDKDKSFIYINKKTHRNKTQIILTLLHELSHLLYTKIHKIKHEDDYLEDIWELEESGFGHMVPKKFRRNIANFELKSLELMPKIAKKLNLKIPKKTIIMQKKLDQWAYKVFLKKGKFPVREECRKYWKRLTERYKPK